MSGSIRQRPERGPDVWEVSIDLGGRRARGGRARLTRQVTGSRAEAEAALDELVAGPAPEGRRFELEALLDVVSMPLAALATAAGYDGTAARRWLASGHVSDLAADRLAVAAGLHPAIVWPNW